MRWHSVEVVARKVLPSGEQAAAVLQNKYLRATFSSVTNRLELIENLQTGQKVSIDQGLLWYVSSNSCKTPKRCLASGSSLDRVRRYNSSTGNNALSTQPSGAYIFRPNETYAFNMTKENIPSIQLTSGPLSSGTPSLPQLCRLSPSS
jgi:hypothetical protein